MKKSKKWIPIVLPLIAIIMVVLLYFFYPSRYQVGDTIYEGKYFDSAYDAYNDDDTYPYSEIEEDLATININENYAMWIASTDHNEFITAKMSVKNNQYCSLGAYSASKISDCHSTKLEADDTLGDKDMLYSTILPYDEFKNKNDKSIKIEKFNYKNTTYVYAYKVVHKAHNKD